MGKKKDKEYFADTQPYCFAEKANRKQRHEFYAVIRAVLEGAKWGSSSCGNKRTVSNLRRRVVLVVVAVAAKCKKIYKAPI